MQAGQDANLTTPGGLIVSIPGKALTGSGKLSAAPVTDPTHGTGWKVALTGGAKLAGTATLRFKHEFMKGEPAPIIVSTEDGSTYATAADVRVDHGYVVIRTTHFSNWFSTWWGDLLGKTRGLLDAVYRDAGSQPACDHEADVRKLGYSIKSDSGNRVYWCLGLDANSKPQLRVTNGRGYTVVSESMPGLTPVPPSSTDVVGLIANAIKDRVSTPGDTVTLVGPGGALDYTVSGSGTMLIGVKASAAGYLVSAGQFAVDTLSMILGAAGKTGMTKTAIAGLFNWESCLSGYSSATTATVQTGTQAANYFNDAIGTTLGCLSGAIEKAGLGVVGVAIATQLAWLISGVRTALNGFGAAADTALNPFGYTITLTAPATLPGLPAALQGKWCTKSTPGECFGAADIISRYPHAFVYGSSSTPEIPGATDYGICLESDMGDGSCSMAASEFIRYFPVGVGWNCVQATTEQGYPSCDPDFTTSHDPSQPRVVRLHNHQQDTVYHDSEAMYRVP
ncbi:hypothetical protein [Leifsonia sp. NPDC058248]|uniref:hypothetical protein n=1 Tax=Leifsonia sp. NPDC058248 TaxID=3346402 RepID=UPI0036D9EB7F